MCLSIPARIEKIEGDQALVSSGGVRVRANVSLIESPKVGDWVLLHAGFAIQKLEETEAKKTLALFDQMKEVLEPRGGTPG